MAAPPRRPAVPNPLPRGTGANGSSTHGRRCPVAGLPAPDWALQASSGSLQSSAGSPQQTARIRSSRPSSRSTTQGDHHRTKRAVRNAGSRSPIDRAASALAIFFVSCLLIGALLLPWALLKAGPSEHPIASADAPSFEQPIDQLASSAASPDGSSAGPADSSPQGSPASEQPVLPETPADEPPPDPAPQRPAVSQEDHPTPANDAAPTLPAKQNPLLENPLAARTDEPSCQKLGTSVDFVDSPTQAAALALKEQKLLFVLHVAGNFEDDKFT